MQMNSGLAAVRAAMQSTTSVRAIAQAVSQPGPAATASHEQESKMDKPNEAAGGKPAEKTAPAPAAGTPKIETAADLKAAYPVLAGELEQGARKDGTAAERARMLGIDKIAMPGHAALVQKCKEDGSSPEATALRMVEAEKLTRENRAGAIKDVEKAAEKVTATPTADGGGGDQPKASTPEQWKEEYAKTPALQKEFATVEHYAAFKKAEAGGQIRVLHRKSA